MEFEKNKKSMLNAIKAENKIGRVEPGKFIGKNSKLRDCGTTKRVS
jgi:hypothetical protein